MTNDFHGLDPASLAALRIGLWIGSATAVLLFVQAALWIVKFFRTKPEKRKIYPQPLAIKIEGQPVTEEDCTQRHHLIEQQMAGIRAERQADTKEQGEQRRLLYLKMERLDEATRQHIEGVRKELSDKIETMPDRIIATLRNFGIIGK